MNNFKTRYRIDYCIRCKRKCTHHLNKIICVYCERELEYIENDKTIN